MQATMEESESGRFVSISRRFVPMDRVLPEHAWVDERLESWGSSLRDRYEPGYCAGPERDYRPPRGQWEYPVLPVSLPSDANREVARALAGTPLLHQGVLTLHYVNRRSPSVICRKHGIQPRDFQKVMDDARSIVANMLKPDTPRGRG